MHAVLAALMLAGGVAQAAPGDDESTAARVPQITIEGDRQAIQRSVHTFIYNMTQAPAGSLGEPLQLWRRPLCFIIAGLPQANAELVLKHLSNAADAAGAPLAQKDKCRPNFYVVVTAHPAEFLRAWQRHDKTLYGFNPLMPVDKFVDTPRPVRIWYNTYVADTQAAPGNSSAADITAGAASNAATHKTLWVRGQASLITYNVVRDFHSVLAIVDLNRVKDLQWSQVADYIGVVGLSRVNPDADFNGADTILRLFANTGTPAPKGVTEWDMSFLRALYHTQQDVRGQRTEIASNMMGDIARSSSTTPLKKND